MRKKCPNFLLINFSDAGKCVRCRFELIEVSTEPTCRPSREGVRPGILSRAIVFLAVSFASVFGFYLSLIATSNPLAYEQRKSIVRSIAVLEEKGFSNEVFLLRYLTVYRSDDNWLNASTRLETAYAATNYPFEIMTIYPEFFDYSKDDTERAAILLHEARHLMGQDEKAAYSFVWKNRKRLGWIKESYADSQVWQNVQKQTREFAPELFVCEFNEADDCTH